MLELRESLKPEEELFRKKEGQREETYITNLLSQCWYSNACIILLVVGSITFKKVDLRRAEDGRSGPACDQCCASVLQSVLDKP